MLGEVTKRNAMSQSLVAVEHYDQFFSRIITKTGTLIIDTTGTYVAEIQLTRIEQPYELKKKWMNSEQIVSF